MIGVNDETVCTLNDLVANAPLTMTCKIAEDTPMWTDIVSALGTLGATVIAAALGFQSIRLTLQDRKARRLQEADSLKQEIRRQAERVACWLQVDLNKNPTHNIVVDNASDQPIWDVQITHWSLGTAGQAPIPVLPPGTRREVGIQPKTGDELTIEEAVDIRFRDNAGRNWFRPAMYPGKLVREFDPLPKKQNQEPDQRNSKPGELAE